MYPKTLSVSEDKGKVTTWMGEKNVEGKKGLCTLPVKLGLKLRGNKKTA